MYKIKFDVLILSLDRGRKQISSDNLNHKECLQHQYGPRDLRDMEISDGSGRNRCKFCPEEFNFSPDPEQL